MKKRFCKICGKESEENILSIKEHIIGTHEEFQYNECEHCKSLELIEIPEDMSKYYMDNYYSFKNFNKIIKFVMKHLKKSYFDYDLFGKILRKFISDNEELYKLMSKMLNENKIGYDSNILDIGCGSGAFLYELNEIGFKNLNGMEPYIEKEIYENNIRIYKSFIDTFHPNESYDLIFLKDSLEHMENPHLTLKRVKELLKKEGHIIITIPVKTEHFYNLYEENWFQLDAPRHLTTFSLKGFESMAKNLDLSIEDIIFDSNPYAFIISEDYIKGNDMYSENSFATRNLFKNEFRKRFKKLNLERLGMKTSFYKLKPIIEDLNKNKKSEHAIFLLKNK